MQPVPSQARMHVELDYSPTGASLAPARRRSSPNWSGGVGCGGGSKWPGRQSACLSDYCPGAVLAAWRPSVAITHPASELWSTGGGKFRDADRLLAAKLKQ